jgi:hypothetical protein
MLKDEYVSKILSRLGWTLPEITRLVRSSPSKPVEVEFALLQRKNGNAVPDGTDLFAPTKDLMEESYETSMVNPFKGRPAIVQTDVLICEIVVEPAGATVELVLNAFLAEEVRVLDLGSRVKYEIPPGEPFVFTQEEVAKAVPGVWIARGMSVEAKIRGCTGSRAAVTLMGWEVVKKSLSHGMLH